MMPIRAESADGMIHEFPDETKPEVVDKAMKDYADKTKDKSTTAGEIGTGMMDPVEGGGQLIANILPARVERGMNELNNMLAEHSGGLIRKLPEGGKNEQMQQREAEIQKQRGSNTSMDWARFAGNILSPINYIGGLVGPEVKAGMSLLEKGVVAAERGEIAGATAGAMQPATKGDYKTEKSMQIGEGAVVGGLLSGVMAGAGAGVEAFGRFLARNYPDNIASSAVQQVLKRISQDQRAGGPTAAQAIELVNTAKKPISLPDVAGENVKGLAGRVARQPGEGRNTAQAFIGKRDEEAAQRLSQDIAKHVSGGPTMQQASEGLLQARSAAARPAYDAAYDLKGVWSPRLDQFIQDPAVKAGLQRGYELERLQALAEGRPITTSQLGVDLDTEGNVQLLDKPNLRLLDMGKRGLDAMIADERNELTGRLSARGVALDQMRKAYVKEIDSLDTKGIYRKAREAWAGYSQSLDSLRMGRNVFKTSPEETAAEVEAMSPANREFYRLGVADMLKERLAKAGLHADEAKQLIRNPWMRDQLKPAFRSPEDFNAFVDAVTQETKMFETGRKVLGGSQTAEREAEDSAGQLADSAGIIGKLAKGHLFDAAKTTFQLLHDMAVKPNQELNAKIAEILFTSDIPSGVQDLLMRGAQGGGLPKRNPASNMAEVLRGAGPGLAPIAATDLTKERAPQQAAQ
jgi:hypothetical protein